AVTEQLDGGRRLGRGDGESRAGDVGVIIDGATAAVTGRLEVGRAGDGGRRGVDGDGQGGADRPDVAGQVDLADGVAVDPVGDRARIRDRPAAGDRADDDVGTHRRVHGLAQELDGGRRLGRREVEGRGGDLGDVVGAA